MIGQTFQPGTDDAYRRTLNQQTGSMSPTAQEALRVISLRLPSVLAGRPIAPTDLLQPRVGGVAPSAPLGGSLAEGSAVTGTGANPYAGLMHVVNAALGASAGPTPSWVALGTPGAGDTNTAGPEIQIPGPRPTATSRLPEKALPDFRATMGPDGYGGF